MDISWLPQDLHGAPGRIGLTRSPGSSYQPTAMELDILKRFGVDHIVCLQESREFQRYSPPESIDQRLLAVLERGMRFTHEPIRDMDPPTSMQAEQVARLIQEELSGGRNLVVHCWAGLGRAGTIAACWLIRHHGHDAEQAIETIRHFRPGAVQSEGQEQMIREFAKLPPLPLRS